MFTGASLEARGGRRRGIVRTVRGRGALVMRSSGLEWRKGSGSSGSGCTGRGCRWRSRGPNALTAERSLSISTHVGGLTIVGSQGAFIVIWGMGDKSSRCSWSEEICTERKRMSPGNASMSAPSPSQLAVAALKVYPVPQLCRRMQV